MSDETVHLTVRADGLPDVMVTGDAALNGMVRTAAELRRWYDALDDAAVTLTYFRAVQDCESWLAGDLIGIDVQVAGSLPLAAMRGGRPCTLTATFSGERMDRIRHLLSTDAAWFDQQPVDADAVWASLDLPASTT